MQPTAPRKRILTLVLSATILATSTFAVPSHAGERNCDNTSGIDAVSCSVIVGTQFVFGAWSWALHAIVDMLTPSRPAQPKPDPNPEPGQK